MNDEQGSERQACTIRFRGGASEGVSHDRTKNTNVYPPGLKGDSKFTGFWKNWLIFDVGTRIFFLIFDPYLIGFA